MRTCCDGDVAEQLAQLLVVAHGQLDVAGDDAGLFVVAGSVACQLQHLSTESRKLHNFLNDIIFASLSWKS